MCVALCTCNQFLRVGKPSTWQTLSRFAWAIASADCWPNKAALSWTSWRGGRGSTSREEKNCFVPRPLEDLQRQLSCIPMTTGGLLKLPALNRPWLRGALCRRQRLLPLRPALLGSLHPLGQEAAGEEPGERPSRSFPSSL